MSTQEPDKFVGTKIPIGLYTTIVEMLIGSKTTIGDVIEEALWDYVAKKIK